MIWKHISWAAPVAVLLHPSQVQGFSDILTQRVMEITVEAAKLSALAYEPNITQYVVNGSDPVMYQHPDYVEIKFYNEEPDQAIVAKGNDGRCYLAFRGTNANFDDWSQNINLNDVQLFRDNNETTGEYCEGRAGFADFLNTEAVIQGRVDLQSCFDNCTLDKEDCVVLTGHSQGGATATHAAILLHRMSPTVVTFGQPPAVDTGCDLIISERFFRYVNSKQEFEEDDDIGFDPVVFSPTFFSKSVHYGYFILLGEDASAVKVLGVGENYTFTPSFFDRQNEIAAHTMAGPAPYSYQSRVEALLSNATEFPISTDGFENGVLCERDYHELCASGRCGFQNLCADKVDELCIKETCEKDEDCVSGKCIYESCANSSGVVELGCPCRFDSQCGSGECDQFRVDLDWTCYSPSNAYSTTGIGDRGSLLVVGVALTSILLAIWF